MFYSLNGVMKHSRGHDSTKTEILEEYFDAHNSEFATVIAKAMVQSHKLKNQRDGYGVESLEAVLAEEGRKICTITFVHEKTRTQIRVDHLEHFETRPI